MPIPDPNKPEQHEGWCPLGENCSTRAHKFAHGLYTEQNLLVRLLTVLFEIPTALDTYYTRCPVITTITIVI